MTGVRLRIVSPKEFAAGLIFAAIGGFALVVSTEYEMGTAARIGPGYFPFCLSLALIGLGLASVARSLRAGTTEPIGRWALVPFAFVLAGVVAFGLLIERAGLVAASLAVVLLACYQRWLARPVEVAVIAATLTVLVVAIFIYFLGMPFSLF